MLHFKTPFADEYCMPGKWSPQKKAVIQITLWTFSIIATLTLFNALFILHTVGPGLNNTINRKLASIKPPQEDLRAYLSPIIKIDCSDIKNLKKLDTKASTARLQLTNCLKVKSIINRTNKNQANLFPLSKKELTSDFILLNLGANEVALKIANKHYIIEITRKKSLSTEKGATL